MVHVYGLEHARSPAQPPRTAIIPSLALLHTSPSPSCSSSPLDFSSYDHHLQHHSDTLRSLQQIHSSLSTTGFVLHRHLRARLLLNYSKLGHLRDARHLFDEISAPSSFLWNTIIRASATTAAAQEEALELYALMRHAGVRPNNYTFPFALKACASSSIASAGKWVHCDVVRCGFQSDPFVEAALVDMYAKCGEIGDARKVFDGMLDRDLVCWTAMITAYEQLEKPEEALRLFGLMQQEGFVADRVTTISLSSAVAQLGCGRSARAVHSYMIRSGFFENVEAGNVVVATYGKCRDVELARSVFDGMGRRDDVSWNSILSGYAQNGHADKALALFHQMLVVGLEPGPVTLLIAVSACAHLGSLHLASQLHGFIVSCRTEIGRWLSNAIIDMYAKCGNLALAVQMFDDCLEGNKDVNSWNVMISAYGMHGHGRKSVSCFHQMQAEGIEPDHVTFTSLLSACSHAGLVDEGREIFDSMGKDLLIMPMVKHYACMVDLLGRAGWLEEAQRLIEQMPMEPNDAVWGALLGACRIHGNRELGESAANELLHLEPNHSGYYILMSNVYAISTRWDEVGKIREHIKSKGLKKPAAYSVIEFGRDVHGFQTAEQSHPEREAIFKRIESLVVEMKMAGYIPDGACVLHDVEDEDKEIILSHHSEKLAVAFAMMRLGEGVPIQVMKNLRICNDCHSAFKCISALYKRDLVVRDASRFHHFQDGSCSCNDYW